jgi:CelD/BcsL family acetyltransferase involved in cellulose biosynthesis
MLIAPNENRSLDSEARRSGQDAVLREATASEIAAWDETVARFANRRIFHKTCWLRYLETVTSGKALFLVYEKEGEVVGCLPGLLLRRGGLRLFGSPLAGWQTESMGPAFDESRISASEISQPLADFLRKAYGVHHVELTSAHMDEDTMGSLRFRGRQVSTYRVPLFPGDEGRALSAVRSKTRNQLRKAIKLGLRARIETEESFVDEFYDQMKEVFRRRGKSIPFTRGRVLECFRHLKTGGNLLALSVRLPDETETCIATGLFMIDERELHLWGWAHRTSYRWYCPMELLTWTAMQRGMERGCLTLDMAGGGDAKLKFGAVPDQTLRQWMWSRYQFVAALRSGAERLYRWQQSVRGRLARPPVMEETSTGQQIDGRDGTAKSERTTAAEASERRSESFMVRER